MEDKNIQPRYAPAGYRTNGGKIMTNDILFGLSYRYGPLSRGDHPVTRTAFIQREMPAVLWLGVSLPYLI